MEELSEHLRARRLAAGLTIEGLAQATGLSRSFLSNVERGVNSPTISSLRAIVDALGVTLTDLFRTVEQPGRIVTARADRLLIARTPDGAITYELLNPNPTGKLELLQLRVGPGADSGPDAHAHAGEEAGVMLAGELDYWVDGVCHHLVEGDTINVRATIPHRYRNPGPVDAVSIWAVTPPSF